MADKNKLEQAARLILEAIGEDPNREGLLETPRRFAEMMEEQMAYTTVSNEEIARQFGKTFTSSEEGPVVVKDISIFSHCEHHLALMYHISPAAGLSAFLKWHALPMPYPAVFRFRNASEPISETLSKK